jgi:hypothetical protein
MFFNEENHERKLCSFLFGSTQIAGDADPVFVDTKGFQCRIDPRGLPAGFTQHCVDASGKVYFKNHASKSTQWDDPRAKLPPAQLADLKLKEREHWFEAEMAKRVAPPENPLVVEIKANASAKEREIAADRKRWDDAKTAEWKQQLDALKAEQARQEAELTRQENEARAALEAELKAWEQQALGELVREKASRYVVSQHVI